MATIRRPLEPRRGRRPAPLAPAGAAGARREALKRLPQLGQVLEQGEARALATCFGRELLVALLRERLAGLRAALLSGSLAPADLDRAATDLLPWAEREAASRTATSLRAVVNATGVILHTNLGRALLPEAAVRRMAEVARAYTTLEYDLARGKRGSRAIHLDRTSALLFPGRSIHVVNNNAAAMLLALNTLAEGREVVVSRGELVEIGGSFRIPDVMRKSGAVLREVGTTNKTRLRDYERAINDRTGLLLKVHPSNYRIVGFTAAVPLREVAALGRRRRLPVLMDQGSGVLLDLSPWGVRDEPGVQEALRDGADVVCCSGDKVLGGPQAGLIVGREDLVRRMRDNPLSRALRVDKMTYAALEAVLKEYARGTAAETVPVLRMIALRREAIEARARRLVAAVEARAGGRLRLEIRPGSSVLGGGSAPREAIPTALIAVSSPRLSARALEERLRAHDPPVIGRIGAGRLLLDLRTVGDDQEAAVEGALLSAAAAGE